FIESIDVRITNVDVVVTDAKGNRVTGLTKNDFELLEDGKPQPISNFYEVRANGASAPATVADAATSTEPAPEPPVEIRKRRVVFFIDNYSIHPFRRNEVFKAIDKQLDELVREGDEAMIATWCRGLQINQPFTSDRVLLRAAMNKVARDGATANSLASQKQLVKDKINFMLTAQSMGRGRGGPQVSPDALASVVRAFADEVSLNAKLLIEAVNTTLTAMSGLEGKKAMVFAGAHLPDKPGADIFQWMRTIPAMGNTNLIAESGHRSLTLDINKLARNANANGVTMYMIDTADPEGGSSESNELPDSVEGFTEFTNTAQAFQTIAKITGGVALTSSRNFDLAVRTVANDLASYYSLGYHTTGDSGSHRIVVRPKNHDYQVRSRSSYVAKSAEQQIEDRVVSNIFNAIPSPELAIQLATAKPVRVGSTYKIPITVTIPPGLTLLPQGDDVEGGFTVYIAVGDTHGAMSQVSKHVQPIRITSASATEMMKKPLVYTSEVMVRPGELTMSVAVVDQVTNSAGFARTKVVAR
ncbi:MAG TPA: VWA domain-containing protein, partial [Thermoanaerobaculia bacterium]|nr:VWA domain-containing protein [Thermoanaerobaculia bacterium]